MAKPRLKFILFLVINLLIFSGCSQDSNNTKPNAEGKVEKSNEDALAPTTLPKIMTAKTFVCAIDLDGLKCWGKVPSIFQLSKFKNPKAIVKTNPVIKPEYFKVCVLDDSGVSCSSYDYLEGKWSKWLNIPSGTIDLLMALSHLEDDQVINCLSKGELFNCTQSYNSSNFNKNQKTLENSDFLKASGSLYFGYVWGPCLIIEGSLDCYFGRLNSKIQIPTFKNLKQVTGHVAENFYQSFCTLDDGGVKCWKYNSMSDSISQSDIKFNTGIKPLSLLEESSDNSGCVIHSSGLECWGAWKKYSPPTFRNLKQVTSQTDFIGSALFCGLDEDGVQCWGDSIYNLGDIFKAVPPLNYNDGLKPVIGYETLLGDQCVKAPNWRSAKKVVCSIQNKFIFAEIANPDVLIFENFSLNLIGADGSKSAYRRIYSESSDSISLVNDNQKIISFENSNFENWKEIPNFGNVFAQGNSGECVALISGNYQTCQTRVAETKFPGSDSLDIPAIKFPDDYRFTLGDCELQIRSSGSRNFVADFEVISDGCQMGDSVDYKHKGFRVSFDLSDFKNYPKLTTPRN